MGGLRPRIDGAYGASRAPTAPLTRGTGGPLGDAYQLGKAVLTAIAFHRIKKTVCTFLQGQLVMTSACQAGSVKSFAGRLLDGTERRKISTRRRESCSAISLHKWQRPQPGQTCRCVWRRRVSQHRHRRACQVWGCLLPRVWHRRQCPRLRRSARMCYGQRGRELMR